ncbi:MAG: hypothetical protein A2017_18895 [Lentisphaerae bacterium GWF2_44_16]|nr:MAG: hypothetical protein A2017_18895 [Lentisphaerae bacterium GWF2_44_16]
MMIIGNAAWGFRETPLEEQLKITRTMGLKLLELSIAGHHGDRLQLNASHQEISEVKNLFQQNGIELCCFATGNDYTLKDREACFAQLENVKKVIDICSQFGGGHLRIFAGFEPVGEITGKRWKTMIDCLVASGEYCMGKNIVPVIETHGGVRNYSDGVEHFHSTSSEPDTMFRMLNELPESIKVNFDPANLYAVGIEHPEKVYSRIKSRVGYMHLKDFVRVPGTSRLRPAACGKSEMDWNSLMEAIKDYRGPALIEYENVEDVKAGCRSSLQFIKKFLLKNSKKVITTT